MFNIFKKTIKNKKALAIAKKALEGIKQRHYQKKNSANEMFFIARDALEEIKKLEGENTTKRHNDFH